MCSPHGKAVLFSIQGTSSLVPSRIAALSLKSGEYHTVLEGGYFPRYAPSGHLLYMQQGVLMAAPFDLEDLETTGPSAPVLEGIRANPRWGLGSVSLSRDGSLAYLPRSTSLATLLWVDRHGREHQPLVEGPLENPRNIRLSPDGRRLALMTGFNPGFGDLWVYYLDNRPPTRLTTGGRDLLPVWVQGGSSIAFASTRAGGLDLFSIPSDGSSSEPELLLKSPHPKFLRAWSHRTEELLFEEQNDIMAISLKGDREPRVVVQTEDLEGMSALSSDGRWHASISDLTGRFEVLVRPYPGSGAPMRVSTNGGVEPVWGPGDRELYYIEDHTMMAVRVTTDPDFRFEPPETLFELPYSPDGAAAPTYDVGPDGRFVMAKPVGGRQSERTELVIILNWFEELERLVPTK